MRSCHKPAATTAGFTAARRGRLFYPRSRSAGAAQGAAAWLKYNYTTMFLDIFLILILLWAVFSGWRNGFLKEGFNALGVIGGLLIALVVYGTLTKYLLVNGTETNQVLSIIAFLLLCIVLPIVGGFIVNQLTRAVRNRLVGLPNCLLGSLFSVVKFALILSVAFNTMEALRIMNPERTAKSVLYRPVCRLLPFLENKAEAYYERHERENQTEGDTVYIRFDRNRLSGDSTAR